MLSASLARRFSINPKRVHKMLQESTQKIKGKQTINDFDKMQNFVRHSVQNNKLGGLINKTARVDSRFDSFMNDLGLGDEEPSSINTAKKAKENPRQLTPDDQYQKEVEDLIQDIRRVNEYDNSLTIEERVLRYKDEDNLAFDVWGSFKLMIMERKMTTNTTSLRRISKYKALVWCGNCNGVIGYGKAVSGNMKICIRKAISNCKQNLVAINLDFYNTCPQSIYSKFGRYQIVLWSRKFNNAWGHPKYGAMMQIAGLRHCMFKFLFDEPNNYSLVYCLMKLFTQNTTPKLMAEQLGRRLYDTSWSSRKYKRYEVDETKLY
jgi:small subunit ribosomal protein S5